MTIGENVVPGGSIELDAGATLTAPNEVTVVTDVEDGTVVYEDGKYYVTPYGAKIEITGKKAEMLAAKGITSREIVLGVRPEHFTLSDASNPAAIPCKIKVNEMMGSELHLHVVEDNGDKLIVRIPTVSLDDDQRKALVYDSTLHVTFEGKVMHFFDPETETNLLV